MSRPVRRTRIHATGGAVPRRTALALVLAPAVVTGVLLAPSVAGAFPEGVLPSGAVETTWSAPPYDLAFLVDTPVGGGRHSYQPTAYGKMGVNPLPVPALPAPTQLSSGPDRRSSGIFDLYYAQPQSSTGGTPSEADDIVRYSTAGSPALVPVPHVNTKQDEYDPAVEGTSGTTLAFARSASAERQTIYLRTLGTDRPSRRVWISPAKNRNDRITGTGLGAKGLAFAAYSDTSGAGTESLYVKPAGKPVVRVAHASISDSGGTDHSFGRPVVSGRYVFSSFSTRRGDDGATSYVLLRTTISTGRTVSSPLADEDEYRTVDPRSEGAGLGLRFGPPPAAAHAR